MIFDYMYSETSLKKAISHGAIKVDEGGYLWRRCCYCKAPDNYWPATSEFFGDNGKKKPLAECRVCHKARMKTYRESKR